MTDALIDSDKPTDADPGESDDTSPAPPPAPVVGGGDGEDPGPGRLERVRTWLATRTLSEWVTFVIVAFCASMVFWTLQPQYLLSSTIPTGGDMSAHVWGPAFLRDHLLPKGQITGWSPDWYAGYPAFQFYMVLPFLAI